MCIHCIAVLLPPTPLPATALCGMWYAQHSSHPCYVVTGPASLLKGHSNLYFHRDDDTARRAAKPVLILSGGAASSSTALPTITNQDSGRQGGWQDTETVLVPSHPQPPDQVEQDEQPPTGGDQRPHRAGRGADGQRGLGTLLSRTRSVSSCSRWSHVIFYYYI